MNDQRPPAGVSGLHHVSLTVSDLTRSVPWYQRTLGLEPVGDQHHDDGRTVVLASGDGLFVLLLQEHKAHEGATFSEFRPGLDHLSFRVSDKGALVEWSEWLASLGIDCQPLRDEPFGSVLIFRDPDRIQLELFADPD